MSSPRLRRLQLDQERLVARFRNWPAIQITGMFGLPPEQYRVTYNIKGLYSTATGQIFERTQHVMEINLSLGYPRRAPQGKMLTPVFHPNFDEVSVCIGDFWAASEGLDDLIVRIGRMIAYQEYNTKSPLNGLAAKWAAQNAHLLPVDNSEVSPPAENPELDTGEKVVVKLDEQADPDLQYAPRTALTPPPFPKASFPRLDFGNIAIALQARTTIGRSPENSIQLAHESVSTLHAEILQTEQGYILRDRKSTNGTLQNNDPITEAILAPGDRICFGDLEAEFLD